MFFFSLERFYLYDISIVNEKSINVRTPNRQVQYYTDNI